MNAASLINQDSGDVEFYTPIGIVDAARFVMGGIDLDPASSAQANIRIAANLIFTREEDGLSRQWLGRVWMNHPFGRKENPKWINKLEKEFLSCRVTAAICITFASTSEAWFQPLLKRPQCFLSPRTNYYLPDGTKKRGVTKGSVVTYFGANVVRFSEVYKGFGVIKI